MAGENQEQVETPAEEEIQDDELEFRKSIAEGWDDDETLIAEQSEKPIDSAQGEEGEEAPKEPAQEKEEKETPAPDPLKDLPEGIKNILLNINSNLENFSNRLTQTESRLGGIQNEFYAAKKAAESAPAGEAPTTEQMKKAAESPEEWEQLKEDFPEWNEAIAKYVDYRLAGIKQGETVSPEVINDAIQKHLKDGGYVSEREMQIGLLSFFHSDWDTKRQTPEFKSWLQTQSPETQAKFRSELAVDAIDVLDQYDAFRGSTKSAEEIAQERRDRLKKGATPKSQDGSEKKPLIDVQESEQDFRKKAASDVFKED